MKLDGKQITRKDILKGIWAVLVFPIWAIMFVVLAPIGISVLRNMRKEEEMAMATRVAVNDLDDLTDERIPVLA